MAKVRIKKPATPGQRGMSTVNYRETVTAKKPHKPLLKSLKKHSARSRGKISVRFRGGGNKRLYRIVDFRQNKFNVPARVETIEYDPYRTAFIALVVYKDGERKYILAPEGLKVGDEILTKEEASTKIGNRLPLRNIPPGTFVHNVEMKPGEGGKIARSAGSWAKILGIENDYAMLEMPSSEIRKVKANCLASIGQVSKSEHRTRVIGKAGKSRHMGRKPKVRGSAMNPNDHPYGGGEGRQPRGTKRPKTKWGKVTGGRKTRRKKKWSNKLILRRRKKKKRK